MTPEQIASFSLPLFAISLLVMGTTTSDNKHAVVAVCFSIGGALTLFAIAVYQVHVLHIPVR